MIRQPESWTHRALNPHWQWNQPGVQIAANTFDVLAMANWQRGGGRGGKPALYPRPTSGRQTRTQPRADKSTPDDPIAVPMDQVDRLLARPRG